MQLNELYQRLFDLEEQKFVIEQEITAIKQEIDKQSPFSKADKIALFYQLFIGNELTYAKQWISFPLLSYPNPRMVSIYGFSFWKMFGQEIPGFLVILLSPEQWISVMV